MLLRSLRPGPRSSAGSPVGRLIVREPHARAGEAAAHVLDAFPSHLLEALVARRVTVWLLDRGETVETVPLLDPATRAARWHGGVVRTADCAGLTAPIRGGLLVIAPWDRAGILRHEFGHALGALLTRVQLDNLKAARASAASRGRFVVPLASRSLGEYLACGAAHYALPRWRAHLEALDPALGELLTELWQGPLARRADRLIPALRRPRSASGGQAPRRTSLATA